MSQRGHDFWEAPLPTLTIERNRPSDEHGRPSPGWTILRIAAGMLAAEVAGMIVLTDARVQSVMVSSTGLTTLGWIVAVAPLALTSMLGSAMDRLPGIATRAALLTYAAAVGMASSTVLVGLAETRNHVAASTVRNSSSNGSRVATLTQ